LVTIDAILLDRVLEIPPPLAYDPGIGGKISLQLLPAAISARKRSAKAMPRGIRLEITSTKPQPRRSTRLCSEFSTDCGTDTIGDLRSDERVLNVRRRAPIDVKRATSQLANPTSDSAIENPSG
jgi:hypothetical protein